MMVPDSCEDALGPFEDRYVDVSTFRARYWKAGNAGSAVVSAFQRYAATKRCTPSTCSAMA
jgi:hypothetical protein